MTRPIHISKPGLDNLLLLQADAVIRQTGILKEQLSGCGHALLICEPHAGECSGHIVYEFVRELFGCTCK